MSYLLIVLVQLEMLGLPAQWTDRRSQVLVLAPYASESPSFAKTKTIYPNGAAGMTLAAGGCVAESAAAPEASFDELIILGCVNKMSRCSHQGACSLV